ncbi:MAG: P-type conjugative transfer protein TrbJ [Synergistaceae bacterium]|jgi:P-type conjugative transfer protein TrbJ|nr:P-type conjugative transfer protein TrbJ [Synergistaceae bacterium]
MTRLKGWKNLKKIAALCVLCCFAANAAFAGGGLTGGATEITQLMNNSELVAQVAQLAEQIQNQITMIQDLIYNTLTIPDQLFRDVKQIYGKVKGIIDTTKGLAYNLSNMDEELKRRFKSYADMSNISTASGFVSEYRDIVDTQMETVRSTMEAIGVSFEELVNDDASALKELQSKASSANGRNELIQATNQLLGFMAEDAMKLRQLQMMQAQMAGAAYEAERARSDLSNKRIESFFKRGNEDDAYIPDESLIDRIGN